MNIILNPEPWTLAQYKQSKSEEYKLSNYLIRVVRGNEVVLFHTITWAIYSMSSEEFSNIMDFEVLKNNKVLIQSDINELEVADAVYKLRMRKPGLPDYEYINTAVILTTTACNARCAYCYEKDFEKKEPMTLETAEAVVKFINSRFNRSAEPFHLQWFGGEPLLNKRVIEYITERLYELEIPFFATITTNGYLLDNEFSKRLTYLKVNSIQVTLDGINEEYNRIKNYVYSDVDAYLTVINNLHSVLENSTTRINIRVNASNDNIFKLYDEISYIKEEFKGQDRVSCYVCPLFEYLEDPTKTVEGYWDELKRISELVEISTPDKIDQPVNAHMYSRYRIDQMCYAYNGKGVTIAPNGDFTPCEHVKDADIFGNVFEGVKDWSVVTRWQTFDGPEIQYCRDSKCPLHPLCARFYLCEGVHVCKDEDTKLRRIGNALNRLNNTVEYFYSNKAI